MNYVVTGGPQTKYKPPEPMSREVVVVGRQWNNPNIFMMVRSNEVPEKPGGITIKMNLADYWVALAQELTREIDSLKLQWLPQFVKRKLRTELTQWMTDRIAPCGQRVVEGMKAETTRMMP